MNIVWTVTTILAISFLTFANPDKVLSVCVDSSAQALTTAFGLCGVYCLWMGIFNVAEQCRLVEKLSLCTKPVNNFLYGNVSEVAKQYISLNEASNLLALETPQRRRQFPQYTKRKKGKNFPVQGQCCLW